MGPDPKGRYNAVSGEMRSNKMASRTLWIGRVAQFIGLALLLYGILLFFDFPDILGLRIGSGRR